MAVLEAAQAARPGSQTTCPTVAVIGTGLIGTSVGPALKRSGVRVPGADVDPSNLVRAVDLGAIDEELHLDGLRSGDAVVVAVPTGSTEVVLENDVAVTEALDAYIDRLSVFRDALAEHDRLAVHAFFAEPAALLTEFLPDRPEHEGATEDA